MKIKKVSQQIISILLLNFLTIQSTFAEDGKVREHNNLAIFIAFCFVILIVGHLSSLGLLYKNRNAKSRKIAIIFTTINVFSFLFCIFYIRPFSIFFGSLLVLSGIMLKDEELRKPK